MNKFSNLISRILRHFPRSAKVKNVPRVSWMINGIARIVTCCLINESPAHAANWRQYVLYNSYILEDSLLNYSLLKNFFRLHWCGLFGWITWDLIQTNRLISSKLCRLGIITIINLQNWAHSQLNFFLKINNFSRKFLFHGIVPRSYLHNDSNN